MKNVKMPQNIFIVFITVSIIAIIFTSTISAYLFYTGNKVNISTFITNVKDIFNIAFFILIALITVLSYFHAKASLFTPIKTEIFKLQIRVIEELLSFFQNKLEHDFMEMFDYSKIFRINATQMVDSYIRNFFKTEIAIDLEKRKEIHKEIAGSLITEEYAKKHFRKPDYRTKTQQSIKPSVTNPAIILSNWKKYYYGKIDFTHKYKANTEKLRSFIDSPLLPSDLKTLLKEFNKKVAQNITNVGTILTTISQELPDHFPNAESVNQMEFMSFWNTYNKNIIRHEDDAKKILDYINNYLSIEKIKDKE